MLPPGGGSRERGGGCVAEVQGDGATKVPWLGDIARKFATSQMARTMAALLSGGIPLVQALDVASRAVSNRYIAHELESMAQRVREGESLAGTMRSRRIFPDVAVKMTEVGEATGLCRTC